MIDPEYDQMINDKMKGFYTVIKKAGFEYKQHQYDGVEWCLRNETSLEPYGGCKGGFLSDEMGLGKTITMIGTMFIIFSQECRKHQQGIKLRV